MGDGTFLSSSAGRGQLWPSDVTVCVVPNPPARPAAKSVSQAPFVPQPGEFVQRRVRAAGRSAGGRSSAQAPYAPVGAIASRYNRRGGDSLPKFVSALHVASFDGCQSHREVLSQRGASFEVATVTLDRITFRPLKNTRWGKK